MYEIKHHYGPHVHIVSDPFLLTVLARLCSPDTYQPSISQLVELLYASLIKKVLNQNWPLVEAEVPTRMTQYHPDQKFRGKIINSQQKVVVVNLARAGNFPSHVCYLTLHSIVHHSHIRQDHIFSARTLDQNQKVTGASWGGMKIGGDIDNSIVIFPDPMGATGNTIVSAIDYYKNHVSGKALKYIAIHLIVTPEYLKNIMKHHPDVEIYAVRVDRGLSTKLALENEPGFYWDQEKGLNDKDYIVPGGGGFGEIMNNAFV